MSTRMSSFFSPKRFRCSPKMHAILGYLFEENWTHPEIRSMAITSDGYVVADGDFLGTAEDLLENLKGCIKAAEMPGRYVDRFWEIFRSKVDDFRPSSNKEVVTRYRVRCSEVFHTYYEVDATSEVDAFNRLARGEGTRTDDSTFVDFIDEEYWEIEESP